MPTGISQIFGFAGTIIVAIAYIPQITHLIRKHCAFGISVKAWLLWCIAAILILFYAISTKDFIFITLQSINIVAILFILIFTIYHQDKICPEHKEKFF